MPDESPAPPSLKHELRTPLNHIIGYCEMLIEEAEDNAEGPRAALIPDLQKIHRAGRRLLGVINDLFDASIPESKRRDESYIHHEVRTPLNQIIGYAELLQEEAADLGDEACLADLARIHAASHRLLELVLENFLGAGIPPGTPPPAEADKALRLLHRSAGAPDDESAGAVPARSTAGGRILLVDDDGASREMLGRRLRRLGYTVETARDGAEALEMIRTGSFDLLLLDLVMPGMGGHEVLEYLRINQLSPQLPVIVLSASDDSGEIVRSIELGADDYLAKPFDPNLLQARLNSSLEKKRLRDREAAYLHAIEREKERSDDLLHVILPADVAAELKKNGEVRPRRIDNVAVLFADVAGFTSYCESRDPQTIHRDLQSLVKELEILTATYRMEKIKTIGDAYLAAAGLLRVPSSPVLDCVRCGLAMIDSARRLPNPWELRVGVHCGPVVAGVVGRQKYQYDIWGDTVNVAARMQGEARPGGLCVSADTWSLLEPHCHGKSLGRREIKGKGSHEIFEVARMKE